MSLRDEIVDAFQSEVEKQNPWQPYRGQAGGEGWVNMLTGEVRYQDARPEPGEGMPEDHEGDVPTPEEEPPDELGEPDVIPYLEEGDEIEIKEPGGPETVEVREVYEDDFHGMSVEVENDEGDVFAFSSEDEILSHPAELEPPDGWAEGWVEPPDDHGDLESDQIVEVYDVEQGEYVEAEVVKADEWEEGPYVHVRATAEGDDRHWEFLDGEVTDSHSDAVLTAAEDIYPPVPLPTNPFPADVEEGEDVLFWDDELKEIRNGEVVHVKEDEDGQVFEVQVMDEETGNGRLLADSTVYDHTILGEQAFEEFLLSRVEHVEDPMLTPEEPADLAMHEGALAEVEHPAMGKLVGDIDIVDHGEAGRHAYVGDSEVGIPLDDPDHPLHQAEIGRVEDTWEEVDTTEPGILGDMQEDFGVVDASPDPGDGVIVDGEFMTVTGEVGGEYTLSGLDEPVDESQLDGTISHYSPGELPDPPDADWDEAIPDSFNQEDTVAFYDPETGEIEADVLEVAAEPGAETVSTEQHGEVPVSQVRAWADTGLEVPNQIAPEDVGPGSVATFQDADGDTFDAYVMDSNTYGIPSYEVITEDGTKEHIEVDERNLGLADVDLYGDASEVIDSAGDWREEDLDTLAQDFYDSIVDPHQVHHDNYLSKLQAGYQVRWFFKEAQENIRLEMMQYFPPDEVEGFYDSISQWKSSSESHYEENRMLEEAFRQARGSDARVRGEHEDRPGGPSVPQEWVAMAEVATKMSQRYFEEHVAPSTGGTLTRDCSDTSKRSFMLAWADNPDAQEFGVDGRALNNFQIKPGTWKDWRVTPEVDPEQIGLMTDFMFNPMGTNAQEDEVWVDADGLTVDKGEVGVGGSERTDLDHPGHFDGDPEDWSLEQTEIVAEEIAREYPKFLEDEGEVYRPEQLSDTQVDTFLRVAERADEAGISSMKFRDFRDAIQAEAVERGITTPGEIDEETIEHITEPEDLPVDTEVTVRDHGEEIPGVVVGYEGDQIEVENYDTGAVGYFDPEDIEEIDWAPEQYGPPAEVDMSDVEADDFEPLDEVYVWSGGDWQDGTVTSIEDGSIRVSHGEHGQKDLFDEDMVHENYVVPQNRVGEDAIDQEGAETILTADTGDTLQLNPPESFEDEYADDAPYEVEVVDDNPTGGGVEIDPGSLPWIDQDEPDPELPLTLDQDDSNLLADTDGGSDVDTSSLGEGDQVLIETDYDDEPVLGEINSVYDHGEYSVDPVHEEQASYGNYSVSDDDIVEADPSEGSDDGGEPDLSEGDEVSFETAGQEMEGEVVEAWPNAGEVKVETGDGVTSYQSIDEVEPVEGSDEIDTDEPVPLDDLHDADLGVGEYLTIESPAGEHYDVRIEDVSVDPNAPIEVATETGSNYLIWPDGDMEAV